MTIDDTLGPRLEELRERLRVLEEGIRTLQARLAAWDPCDEPTDHDDDDEDPAHETVRIRPIPVGVEP
jgi:hypothetical protein